MRNAEQILKIITAAFGSQLFDLTKRSTDCNDQTDIEELACEWRKVGNTPEGHQDAAVDREWVLSMTKVRDNILNLHHPAVEP